ncbi:hypothetical protein E6Q11_02935 [Candidatus Dojkabacteria bacterium]|uniref:Uncharacterized protein n=1 Tax=Candidatus Dojkabacteria bacterium TaxID=2099670 RepID=A0A5C7J8T8_9BACT|nr:MAG: hypothetical protein E6Q11_02935 [Candidatus Dojkabacteria bacterium]
MDFSLLTDHPDYEEIVSKIATGTDPKVIAHWLKVKYSEKDQKHLQLSLKLIQEFVDKHADLDTHLKRDVLAVKTGDTSLSDYKIAASLMNNKTYMERLQQLADTKVDIKKMITELVLICRERMMQVFDKIQENPTNTKGDYVLLKYFETLFIATEKFDKIVNEAPDQVIQVNIQNQMAEQIVSVFQEAIRETLTHIDPESALLFIEIFAEKFNALKLPKQVVPTPETYETEAKLLREVVIPSVTPQLEK